MEEKNLYTIKEIAKMLGVHKNTVRNHCKNVAFLFNKVERKHFYTAEEVQLIKTQFNVK